jgi:hypothetical protein
MMARFPAFERFLTDLGLGPAAPRPVRDLEGMVREDETTEIEDEPPIGASPPPTLVRWSMILTIYTRFLATIWMLKGLLAWAQILGLGGIAFTERPPVAQVVLVGFALGHCCVGVGLWLLAKWGLSLWFIFVFLEVTQGLAGFGGAQSAQMIWSPLVLLFVYGLIAFARSRFGA